jgi:cyclase
MSPCTGGRSTVVRNPGVLLTLLLLSPGAATAQDFDAVEIQIERVAESIYMLVGLGGNIGVSIGEDGTFIVDDQFAPLTEKIVAAIASLTDDPVDFVINTHWHYDHTDGNENFGGAGAVIVSHENSRRRMEVDQLVELFDLTQTAYDRVGLPKVTFDESVRFHLNGETIDVFYLGAAHTDGDAIVYFRDSNVVHTGDVFVRYGLPFIDQTNGGSINGTIDVVGELLDLIDDNTVIIPGHGVASRRSDLLEYRAMLVTIRDRVQGMVDEGRSFTEILEAKPAAGYPANGVAADDFLRLVYDSLRERR